MAEVCTSGHPYSYMRSVGQASSRPSIRVRSQSSTSSSTHPTLLGPSCTRLGNWPAFSRRATCCGEYRTNSFSWGFESILITISPSLKSIAMPKVTTIPRLAKASRNWVCWRGHKGESGIRRCRKRGLEKATTALLFPSVFQSSCQRSLSIEQSRRVIPAMPVELSHRPHPRPGIVRQRSELHPWTKVKLVLFDGYCLLHSTFVQDVPNDWLDAFICAQAGENKRA